ncbi:hypothetical protein [Streptomyces rubradiris]|uniref:Asp23/Gls24 family envelope stress response protein n=1 Tax=Streptomyces rubradiris TaxID=285531 RepID=A0ABQ3RKW7_STRRR|nr:hypothetical protein [Streptomyces rubradiris]GHH10967.1 hypothetical protein GCM10018792_35190 [Streptomyces rubradiris]GHI56515.1 hypothetical protein Srubr_63610 [Streptomyces rubradiris]
MALDGPRTRPSEPPAADGPPFEGDEVLSCGRLLSRAWEQARDAVPAADPHTRSCPHCREAAEGLAAVSAATRALRAEDPPGLRALAARVMDTVRAEVRRGRLLPVAGPGREPRIAESAAAKVLRRAADTVPGARAAACRLVPVGDGIGVRVTMTLAAALDHPLPERVHQVRRTVLRSAGQDLGMAVTAVDIAVIDVLEPEPVWEPFRRPGSPGGGGT